MRERLSALNLGTLSADSLAVLLDFDGTLVEIAARPEGVVLKQHTLHTLTRLESLLGGAVAIVSGRSIAAIDRIFAPHVFAVAGIHGIERRDAAGRRREAPYDPAALEAIASALARATRDEPGLLIERKPGAVAMHYRQRPELGRTCRRAAARIAARHPGASLLTGKMVVEVKLGGRTKADAVRDFMAEPPFAGRRPLYAGDDVTDEDAFRAVAAMGGIAIKIGNGRTAAAYRLADTEAFLCWLDRLGEALASKATGMLAARPGS